VIIGSFGDVVDIVDVLGDICGDQLHIIESLGVDLAVLPAPEQIGYETADQRHGQEKADNEAEI